MEKHTKIEDEKANLRQKAEDLHSKNPINPSAHQPINPSEADVLKLIHELEVKQIELDLIMDELELKRRQNEDLNRSIFQSTHSIMMLVDPDTGQLKDVNPAACKFYGWSEAEMLGKNISDINTLSKAEMRIEMQKAKKEKRNHFFFKHRLANGELRDVEVFSSPLSIGNSTLLHSVVYDITERKLAEEKLRVSEEKYRSLVESINDVIYEVSMLGEIKYVSPSVIQVLGFSANEVVGTNILNYIHPDDRELIGNRLSSLQEKDYTYLEYRYINKSGEICWVRSSTTALTVNGKVIGGTGTLTDITARKLAETALLDSEEKYSKLFDTSPYAIMVTNATDGKIIEVNQAFTALSGYTKDEAIADSTIGLNLWVNPDDRQKVIAVLSKGSEFPATEFLFNTKHNKTIVGLLASQIVYIGGKPHILSSIDDITESKEANEKIRLSEEKYRTIFESVSDIYFETTMEGIILEISPSIEVVSKGYYTRAELIGQSLLTFYGDTSQRAAFQTELKKQGHLFDYELQFLVKGGAMVPLSFSASLIMDGNGNPVKIVGSIRDISERKKAEEALRESESLYKAILNTSPDNITITDLSGNILFSSSKALEMFGYKSMDELVGINLNEFIAVEDQERATSEVVKMHQGILTGPAIYKAVHADKTQFDIEVNGEMMRDIDGTPTKMVFVVRDVTERLKAEQDLKESEEKFRTIAEQTADLISITDSNGIITYASPACSTIFLCEAEEMCGKHFTEFLHDPDSSKELQAFRESLQKGMTVKNLEMQMKRSDGTTFAGELNGSKFQTGTQNGTLVTIQDISERKNVENALKKSEEAYRFIAERSTDLIFVFRLKPEMGFEYVSPSAERITGYTPEDHYNDPMLGMKLIHPDDLHLLERLQQGIIDTGITKLRWIKKDGSIIWTESQNIPIYDENGELTGMQGRATDITLRHQSEEALRESEKKFQAIIQSQAEGIGILDKNDVFEFTNLAALNIFETDSLIGASLFDFLPPDEIIKINEQTKNRQKGAESSYEVQIITKKGNARHILVSSSPKFDENNKYVGAYGVFRDITERKIAEEILKQSEADLNYAQEIAKMGSWEHSFVNNKLIGSKYYYSLLGLQYLEKQDMLFDYFLSLVHPDDLEIIHYLKNCEYAKDETKIFDIRLIMPNGTIKWLQNNVVAVYNDGLLVGLKGVNIDITEKKQAEKELKKLSQAVEQSPAMTYITDTNGNIEYVNPKLLELTGYSKTELIGQTPRIFSSGEKLQDEYRNLWETIKSGNEWRGEFHNKKKNGELYWSSASLSPIFDTDRNIAHFLAIQEDITQRKIAEYQLRSSEEKYRRIFESVQDAYFEASIDGMLLEISPSIEIITKGQYRRDEMIGQPFAGVYANAEDRNIYFSKLFEQGRVTDYELSLRNKDGSLIPVEVSAMLSLDANGKPEKITGILRDITDRKMAEEILKQSEASLNYSQEIAKMGSWELSIVTGKVSWSKGYYLLVGMKPDNIEGLNDAFNKMVHPDDSYLLDEKLAEIKRERKPASIDLRFILPNGQVKWVQNNIVPVFDGDTLVALKGVNVDITEQKLAEENIKQQNRRLQAIISTLPDIVFVIGLDGIYHEFYCSNPEQLLVSPEKIIGSNIRNVFDEERANTHLQKFSECIETNTLISYEYSVLVDEKQEYFEARLAPFGDDRVLALIRDITKRKQADDEILNLNETLETRIVDRTKQLKDTNETLEIENQRRVVAEAELALEKQRLADIIKGTNVGTWEWNIQSGQTVFNERWAEIIGYSIDEISPLSIETWTKFAHPDDLKASGELLEKHFKGESDYYSFESRMKHKNGTWAWVLDRGKVHAWDDEGKPLLMSGTHQDITERKKVEVDLQWNKTLLELMSNSSPLGFLVVDNRTDDILYFNQRFCQIWEIEHITDQMHRGELKNNDIIPYCLPVLADIPAFAESCKPLQDELNRIVVEDEIAFTDNRTVHRFTTQIRGLNDEYFGRFYIFEDITERKRTSEFETELLRLSLQLTGIPNDEIPAALNLALKKIGSFLGADRAYIFEIDQPNHTMNNTYEWCNEGVYPQIEHLQNLACDHLPMWWEKVQRNENMVLPSIQDLPDAWQTEREHLQKQGIQSLISIPMLTDNNLIGFVGLDSVFKRREYTDSEINILRVWSNMLASLLNHRRQEEFIEQTRKNYETFFNTIDDFLFVLDEQGNIIHTNTTVTKRLGYTTDELLGKSVLMVHPEDPRQEAGRIVGEMLAGTADFCPVPLVTKAGNHLAVETRVVPGFWDGKAVIFGVTKDVSKIKLSEEKFSKAFQSNSVLMAISTLEGKFIDVNHKFLNAFGYTREEIIGNTAKDLNMFLDPELLGNELKRASQTPPRDVELDVRSKSGELITGLFSSDEISIGDESCLLTIMVDITERKKAQLALQESESRFSLFMDYLPAVVFLKDQDGRMLFVNKYMQDAFGANDWVGKTMMEVFPNELGEKLTANDKDSMELGFQKIEESLLQLDGKIHHYETQKFTIDRLGMEPWLGGISLDITERKLAERLLRESQEQLDLVIKGSNDAPWDWNLVKDQLFYSLKWWQQIGYTPEEIPSDSSLWRNLTHPDDVGHVTDVLEKVLESKNDSYECEFRLLHKKGHYVPVLSRGFITRDSTGKPTRITGSNMDLTERKKAENEVLNAKNEAEKANFAKSEFLSRMSHELRTPMNSILGFAQLMEMGDLNPKQTKGVNHILTSGKYLLKLIDEVLDISRIEAGKLTLSPEPVQVGSIIMEMLESIQPLIASRHIKIIHTISSNDERYVRADRQRLKQVLLNLLTNAVKYNREGGTISISKTVMAPSEGCDACMQISISDTGLGISEEGMFKIFTPFERIGAEKTKTEGTGLGLAVVKKFMEAMDGNVGVASKQGEGSTFWIELPLDGNTKSRKLLKEENKKLTAELGTANTEIGFQNEEKTKRADELKLANVELAFQNEEKVKRTDELKDARKEIDFLTNQNREQAVELDHANQELSFRNDAPTNTGTILYIEDNESNIELIQQIIANQRPNIRLVSHLTGEESVAKAIGCAPDFILLDLDLPDLHGSQVFEQLKANEKTKDIPVVIISADAMPLQYEKLMQAGAKDYITKPVDIVVFLKAVDAWIGKGRIT